MSRKTLALLFALAFLLSACAVSDGSESADTLSAESSFAPESSEAQSNISSAEASSDETSGTEASSDETSSSETSSNEASSNEASSNEASSEDASSTEASSEDASSTETSSDEASSEDASSEASSDDGVKKEEIVNGFLIDVNDRIMERFSYSDKSTSGIKYAELINALYGDLKLVNENIKVYSMTVPKSSALYSADTVAYKHLADCAPRAFEHIKTHLDDGVIYVDVYNALLPHKDENIYFRTDYHWAPLGAFYGAEALANAAQVQFDGISCYTAESRVGFLGALYSKVKLDRIKQNPDTFTVYRSKNNIYGTDYTVKYHEYDNWDKTREHDVLYSISDKKYSSWYLTFLNGDNRGVHITSNTCKNGRKAVILKDSYGNPLAPFLLGSFEELWILDIRYFNGNISEFVKENNITDVSVSLSISSALGGNKKHLETIRKGRK